MTSKNKNRAIILDRDGTLIRNKHYLDDPKEIEFYRDIFPYLRQIQKQGWKIIIGTNQSGIGRGYFTIDALQNIHRRMLELLRKQNILIDAIYFCPHTPKDQCQCRKPNLQMITQAQKEHQLDLKSSIVIGDSASDILWGKKSGTKTILVLSGNGKKTRKDKSLQPDYTATTLTKAIQWILKNDL